MNIVIKKEDVIDIVSRSVAILNRQLQQQQQPQLLGIDEFTRHFAEIDWTNVWSVITTASERYMTSLSEGEGSITLTLSMPPRYALEQAPLQQTYKNVAAWTIMSLYAEKNAAPANVLQVISQQANVYLTLLRESLAGHRSAPIRKEPQKVRNIDKINWL